MSRKRRKRRAAASTAWKGRTAATGCCSTWATSSCTSCSLRCARTTILKSCGASRSRANRAHGARRRRHAADETVGGRRGVANARLGRRSISRILEAEGRRIERAAPRGASRVALDERGRELSTAGFASWLAAQRRDGRDAAFLLGGADGLAPAAKSGAELLLRLSAMTLPHALARVLLAEQLYRASSILHRHPYHRE